MASAGSIFVDLLLRDSSYRSGLQRARKETNDASNAWRRDMDRAKQSFQGVVSPINNIATAVGRLTGIFASALSVQKIVAYSDAWKGLESRLNLVTGSAAKTAAVQQELFDIAQNTAQPLNETVAAYTRLANSLPDVTKKQYDLTRVTDLLSKTLVLSGTNAAGAATFFQQFGQAASSDFKAIGQELQTFADQNPALYKILSDEAAKYGKTLKEMGKDGELSFQFVADALIKQGDVIDEQSTKIALTVGRAFQQLDNAFLKFIGTSSEVSSATSGLALIVSSLAQNLNLLASGVGILAAVYAGRLLTSLTASIALWAANTTQVIAYQAALARMAGVSTAAAAATTALGAAATVAGRALALLGGPIGLALIAVVTLYGREQARAAEMQQRFNDAAGKTVALSAEYVNASKARQAEIRKEVQGLVDVARAESIAARAEFTRLAAKKDAMGEPGMFNIGGLLADTMVVNPSIERAQQRMKQTGEQFGKLEKEISNLGKSAEALPNKIINYDNALKNLNTTTSTAAATNKELSQGVKDYGAALGESTEETESWGINIEEIGKSAATNIQSAFADFLFDPFAEGTKGMLKGFIDTVRRMIAEAAAAQLSKALFGGDSGGGALGGLGSLFSGNGLGQLLGSFGSSSPVGPYLPMFAEGGYLEPGQWGIAGEEGAELIYGGRSGKTIVPQDKMGGGNVYQIDARGADMGAVRRIEQSLQMLAGPGVIEQRVTNAQVRGAL